MSFSEMALDRFAIISGSEKQSDNKPTQEVEEESTGIVGTIKSSVNNVLKYFNNTILRISLIVLGLLLLFIGLRVSVPLPKTG